MNWIELASAMLGGGVLTTVFTRILPSSDKKFDFLQVTQKELLARQNELENRLTKQNEEYILLLRENADLKQELAVMRERLTVFENRCSSCFHKNQ